MRYVIGLILLMLTTAALAEPVAKIEVLSVEDLQYPAADAIHGLPFVVETPGVYSAPKDKLFLTDARDENSPVFNCFFQGAAEAALRWDLGAVPAAGRELQELRVYWATADGLRNGINLKFAVRDGATGEWREVCGYVREDNWGGGDVNVFKRLRLTFAPGEVTGFDAVRLVEGRESLKFAPTRLVKVNVILRAPE